MSRFSRSTLTDPRAIIELANSLSNYPKIGLDTESSGPDLIHKTAANSTLNIYRSTLTGLSLALPGEWPESFYVPIGHHIGNAPLPAVAALLRAIGDYRGVIPIHNVKHELHSLHRGPVPFPGFSRLPHCTQVLAWLLQEGVEVRKGDKISYSYGLKNLAPHHFGIQMSHFREVTKGLTFDQLDPRAPETRNYACEDAEVALMLHDKLYPMLGQYPGMEEEYLTVELPFIRVLRHMEDSGMGLDAEELERVVVDLEVRRAALLAQWEALGLGVLITSSGQLQKLYEDGHWPKRGIPKGKSGSYSTEAEYIEIIADHMEAQGKTNSLGYRAARIKLEFAKLNTLITTFGMGLAEKAGQYPDFRLHCEYLHTGTATGRLSSNYPNLQNIPVRTEEGRRIRDAFIPSPGWLMVSSDYSQIELRVLAHFNGRGILYDGYRAGTDVHKQTAATLFGIPLDQVTEEQRGQGKTGNFSTIYGVGPEKFARKAKLKGGKEAGKDFLRRFKEANPETFETLQRAHRAGERKGYVRTMLGRIRKVSIAEKRARVEALRAAGHKWDNSEEYRLAWLDLGSEERKAGNTPIQGGARDIMTLGMLSFFEKMDHSRCKIIGQVHDDLSTEMREDYVEEGMALQQECLENAYALRVPLEAKPKSARKWSKLK